MKRWMIVTASLLWFAVVGAGLSILWDYENAPGVVAQSAPASWPAASGIRRVPGRSALVMVLHPQCPCSRASVGELALVMARVQDLTTAHVLFYKPAGVPVNWHQTDLWSAAAAIPGVHVSVDADGVEGARFGVATSGHTLLYDSRGVLQFSGGITASRGHSGDNTGRAAIVSLLLQPTAPDTRGGDRFQRVPDRRSTSVFGCSVLDRRASTSPM